jgi:hypothetical protein
MWKLWNSGIENRQILLVVGVLSAILYVLPSGNGGDVVAFWGGIQALLSGLNPYDPAAVLPFQRQAVPSMASAQRFLNPPWSIPILLPLFAGPYHFSRALLCIVNVSAFAFTLGWCSRRWGTLPRYYNIVLAVSLPFLCCQLTGQLSVFPMVGLLLLLDEIYGSQRSTLKTALGFYLCSIKPQALYLVLALLPLLMIKRNGLAKLIRVGAFALPFLAFLAWREDLLLGWFRSFDYSTRWRTSTTTTYVRDLLMTFAPTYSHLYWLFQVFWLSVVLVVGVSRVFSGPAVFPLVLVSTLTAPYAWIYDFCALTPIYYLSLKRLSSKAASPSRYYASIFLVALLAAPIYGYLSKSFEIFIVHSVGVTLLYLLQRPNFRAE